MIKTKKEWVEWFNSIDDDVEINIQVNYCCHRENDKLKKIILHL